MLLRYHLYILPFLLELEERDQVILHLLGSYGPADQRGQLVRTKGNVLLDLYSVQTVISALGLNRHHVVRSAFIYADVNLVRFTLGRESRMGLG